MKTKIWKAFIDYEKEEKWLNEMAAKGFAMTHYTFLRYTFEDCTPGEYAYRIQYMEHGAHHPETIRFINFLEENGVEHVDNYFAWAYFRKKATADKFEIYSDFDMRIEHYKRLANVMLICAIVEIFCVISNAVVVLTSFDSGEPLIYNAIVIAASILLTIILFALRRSYMKRIKKLKREREISE